MQEPLYSTPSPDILLLSLFPRELSVPFTYHCSVCREIPSILQISATDVLVSAYNFFASLIFSGVSAFGRPPNLPRDLAASSRDSLDKRPPDHSGWQLGPGSTRFQWKNDLLALHGAPNASMGAMPMAIALPGPQSGRMLTIYQFGPEGGSGEAGRGKSLLLSSHGQG